MPFLLAEILDFQGSAHLIGVGSLSYVIIYKAGEEYVEIYRVVNRYRDITRIFE